MKKTKEKFLTILNMLWSKVLPLILITSFFVGFFFNLWNIQNFSLATSLIISILGFLIIGFGFGKAIKLW